MYIHVIWVQYSLFKRYKTETIFHTYGTYLRNWHMDGTYKQQWSTLKMAGGIKLIVRVVTLENVSISLKSLIHHIYCPLKNSYKKNWMMILCFTSLLTLFKSYWDDERLIMKGSVQSWAEFHHPVGFESGTLWSKLRSANHLDALYKYLPAECGREWHHTTRVWAKFLGSCGWPVKWWLIVTSLMLKI